MFIADIWRKYEGYICSNGAGGTNMREDWGIATLEDCKSECTKDADCTAVLFNVIAGYACYLRKDIELSKCATGDPNLSLFLKPTELTAASTQGTYTKQRFDYAKA